MTAIATAYRSQTEPQPRGIVPVMNGLIVPKRAKGAAIPVPSWWLDEARAAWQRFKDGGKKMADLGQELALAVGRPDPWGHSVMSKFLDGSQVTSQIVAAFVEKFDLLQPVYYPRDLAEARLIQRTVKEAARAANSDDSRPADPAPVVDEKGPAKRVARLRQYDAAAARIESQSGAVKQPNDADEHGTGRVGQGRRKAR